MKNALALNNIFLVEYEVASSVQTVLILAPKFLLNALLVLLLKPNCFRVVHFFCPLSYHMGTLLDLIRCNNCESSEWEDETIFL